NEVVILFNTDDTKRAKDFVASPDLKETMAKAGVIDKPTFYLPDHEEYSSSQWQPDRSGRNGWPGSFAQHRPRTGPHWIFRAHFQHSGAQGGLPERTSPSRDDDADRHRAATQGVHPPGSDIRPHADAGPAPRFPPCLAASNARAGPGSETTQTGSAGGG